METTNWGALVELQADRSGAYIFLILAVATLYDHLITLNLEIGSIWRSKISLPQILFVINRYLGNFILVFTAAVLIMEANLESTSVPSSDLILSSRCQYLGIVQSWGGAIIVWTMQGIMVVRINVMYRGSSKIKALQLVFFAVEIITMSIMQVAVPGQLIAHTCIVREYPDWYRWSWAPILAFECLMLALSLWAGFTEYSKKNVIVLTTHGKNLTYVLMRDSILFPMLAVIMVIFNYFVWNRFSFVAAQINIGIMIFGPRILGCRLVINLREIYYCPFRDEYSRDQESCGLPIQFVQTPILPFHTP